MDSKELQKDLYRKANPSKFYTECTELQTNSYKCLENNANDFTKCQGLLLFVCILVYTPICIVYSYSYMYVCIQSFSSLTKNVVVMNIQI